jgi:peptide/nickel transport system permease protein
VKAYIAERLALTILSAIGVSILVFCSIRLIPGDVVDVLVSRGGYQGVKSKEDLRVRLGLNRPLAEQYVVWVGRLLRGDLGRSLRTGHPVGNDLKQRLPVTLELGFLAIAVAVALGVPIGVISAVTQDSVIDYALRSLTVLLLSIPGYWIATLVILYLALWFSWSPPARYAPLTAAPVRNLEQVLPPAAILGATAAAPLMRYTRTAMLEVLRQDYVRTARAKGLPGRTVLVRHVMRNGMIPIITVIGLMLSLILGGSVIFESIFGLPGMGTYLMNAVSGRDYPQVQAVVLVYSVWVLLLNFMIDLCYGVIDPRIRH